MSDRSWSGLERCNILIKNGTSFWSIYLRVWAVPLEPQWAPRRGLLGLSQLAPAIGPSFTHLNVAVISIHKPKMWLVFFLSPFRSIKVICISHECKKVVHLKGDWDSDMESYWRWELYLLRGKNFLSTLSNESSYLWFKLHIRYCKRENARPFKKLSSSTFLMEVGTILTLTQLKYLNKHTNWSPLYN